MEDGMTIRWMDGWADGWMDGWMDRWMDGQVGRWRGDKAMVCETAVLGNHGSSCKHSVDHL